MNKKISICICVYNKYNFTKLCLNHLSKLNDAEIIVVDNGSSDETQKQLQESKEIIYHRSDVNGGFAKGSNLAYSLSSTDNVLFLNNDIKVIDRFSDWIDLLLPYCKDYLVGPTMGQFDSDFNFLTEENKKISGSALSYMSGWCLASSRENWDKLKIPGTNQIFSEEFFCYFEDTDLSFRAREIGIPFAVQEVPLTHFGKTSSSQLNTAKIYLESKRKFIKKWQNLVKISKRTII